MPFPVQTSERKKFFQNIFWKIPPQFSLLISNKWREFLICQDYQRKQNKNGIFSSVQRQEEEHTTTCAVNVGIAVNRVSEQSLWTVLDTLQKGVHQIATISMIQGNWITDIRLKFKSLTGENFYDFSTFLIQESCPLSNHSSRNLKTKFNWLTAV